MKVRMENGKMVVVEMESRCSDCSWRWSYVKSDRIRLLEARTWEQNARIRDLEDDSIRLLDISLVYLDLLNKLGWEVRDDAEGGPTLVALPEV